MGLFDRLKKAFKHDKKQEEKSEPEVLEELNDSTELDSDQEVASQEIDEQVLTVSEPNLEAEEISDLTVESEKIELETVEKQLVDEKDKQQNLLKEDQEQIDKTSEVEINNIRLMPEEQTSSEVEVTTKIEESNEAHEVNESLNLTQNEEFSTVEKVGQSEDDNFEEELLQEKPETKKYDKGLEKTRKTFGERLNELFANFRRVDEEFFDELEETLILSDVGLDTSVKLTEELRQEVKLQNVKKPRDVQNTIIEKLVNIYEMEDEVENNQQLHLKTDSLSVILFVGVNGAGKTTTIGKMAYQFKTEGKQVLLAAADTFRAGAIDQLVKWGERSGVDVVAGKEGGDPAAVVYDAVQKAKAEGADILLVDTAGRLQNKENLMRELNKIKRVIQKEIPDAPHEVLLVIDATTGQNALVQAKKFRETTDVTGLVLTKLDGTAKGGIILAIRNELKLPVKYVGLGEKMDDLAPFDSEQFIYGLFKDLWVED